MIAWDVLQLVWNHPGNQGRRVKAVCRAVAWQLQKRTLGRTWDLEVFDGMKIRCYPDSYGAALMIYTNGAIDYEDNHFVRAYLRPGDAFLDIGANLGEYTLLASQAVGPQGFVAAYEPGRRAFERLEENVRLNGLTNVQTNRSAIAPTTGEVRFSQTRDLTNRLILREDQQASDEMVPGVTLDQVVTERKFTMGKIDVEGAEPLIFSSGEKSLSDANPGVWLVELKDRLLRRYDSSADQFSRLLTDHGYQLAGYDIQSGLRFSDQPWKGRENVVAVHDSAREQVEQRLAETKAS